MFGNHPPAPGAEQKGKRHTLTPATNQAISPSWKDEVNRRIAEHRCRKPASPAERVSALEIASNMSRRAQEAAARVAARYANAPSFGDALATEAREALRVAEEASRTAIEARKVAEGVLANLRAITSAESTLSQGADLAERTPRAEHIPIRLATLEQQQIETPRVLTQPAPVQPVAGPENDRLELSGLENVFAEPATSPVQALLESAPTAACEPENIAQPAAANNLFEDEWWKLPEAGPAAEPAPYAESDSLPIAVAEVPRELVAARRVRPRIAAGSVSETEQNPQLSIFEVNPLVISTEPEAAAVWEQPDWPRIDPQPQSLEAANVLPDPVPSPEPSHILQPAFIGRRLMALLVDGFLVASALLGAMGAALVHDAELPGLRTIAITSAAALGIIVLLYLALFYTLANATPGMKYARLRFTGFDGRTPTRAQRTRRLLALLLSVLPFGLGFLWSLFDEGKLCWHDRFSSTYLAHQ